MWRSWVCGLGALELGKQGSALASCLRVYCEPYPALHTLRRKSLAALCPAPAFSLESGPLSSESSRGKLALVARCSTQAIGGCTTQFPFCNEKLPCFFLVDPETDHAPNSPTGCPYSPQIAPTKRNAALIGLGRFKVFLFTFQWGPEHHSTPGRPHLSDH
ncbi:hypothetical protein B0H66DRAFT_95968 [Apodospora peruviana]|uniref:Uncharacterized protein n=1 Tax=Apodospora peruviana TaxID=516989 RepID=A0AAE0MG57_9PEZI|nr:hypothetical protein B0H66DRAFT_95968 [Apodospora peruviana]